MEQDKRKVSVLFMLFGTLFCVCLITANVLETKQLSFGPINLTAGVIVFPVSYIINDVVCEVWGYARTRMLIWMGFAMNFFFVIMGAIADWIPGAPYGTPSVLTNFQDGLTRQATGVLHSLHQASRWRSS